MACPFCDDAIPHATHGNAVAVAFDDRFPVADGHRLVVPRSHVAAIEDLGPDDWRGLFDLVREEVLNARRAPDVAGVNVGVNSGAAAGQTVAHAHVHVIPRRDGEVEDPRGGVRWVLPDRADYWTAG